MKRGIIFLVLLILIFSTIASAQSTDNTNSAKQGFFKKMFDFFKNIMPFGGGKKETTTTTTLAPLVLGSQLLSKRLCPDGSERICEADTYFLSVGQYENLFDGSSIQLNDATSSSATITILDSNGNTIESRIIDEGSTKSFGENIDVYVKRTDESYTPGIGGTAEVVVGICKCPKKDTTDILVIPDLTGPFELQDPQNTSKNYDAVFIGEIDLTDTQNVQDVAPRPETGASVTFEVDGNKVNMNDMVIAERHGNFVGSNLQVTKAVGPPGSGNTASVPNSYSSTGALIQTDVGEGQRWYYVHAITETTLELEDAQTGDITELEWNIEGTADYGSWGHVPNTQIIVMKWTNGNTDGISIGTSTSQVKYLLDDLDIQFEVDTDWSTYTTLEFTNGQEIDLVAVDSNIKLITDEEGWGDIEVVTDEDLLQKIDLWAEDKISTEELIEVIDKWAGADSASDYKEACETTPSCETSSMNDLDSVKESAAHKVNIMFLGESWLISELGTQCKGLVYPEGSNKGLAGYDGDGLVDLIEGSPDHNISCPLRPPKLDLPEIIFIK